MCSQPIHPSKVEGIKGKDLHIRKAPHEGQPTLDLTGQTGPV